MKELRLKLYIPSARTILRRLRKLDEYLGRFPNNQKSTYFEHLIGLAFSRGLYLPFYTIGNDNKAIAHRVVWEGSDIGGVLSKAPQGKPDIIAYCFDFYVTIEATQKSGANQWTGEFAQAVRHCDDFVRGSSIEPCDVHIVLVNQSYIEIHTSLFVTIHNEIINLCHLKQRFS